MPFRALMTKNVTVHGILVYTMPESAKEAAMADITRTCQEQRLKHFIGARFPFDQVAAAHEAQEQHSVIGNIVVDVRPD